MEPIVLQVPDKNAWQGEAGTSGVAAGVWSAALGGGMSWQVPEDKHKSVIIAGR